MHSDKHNADKIALTEDANSPTAKENTTGYPVMVVDVQ